MKSALIGLSVLALLTFHGTPARARDGGRCGLHMASCDTPARWADRHDSRDALVAITTEGGEAELVLTKDVVAVQLSDRVLHKLHRKMRDDDDSDDDNVVARAIRTAVLTTVSSVLDHSAECSIRDLREVEYRNGRLVFTTRGGERIFDDFEIKDEDVMRSFSPNDARLFVREFHRWQSRSR